MTASALAACARARFSATWAFHQFQQERRYSVVIFEFVDRPDVRMIERRQHARFAFEPGTPIRIEHECVGQDFDRDVALEPFVTRAIDFAHSAGTKAGGDLIRADASTDEWRAARHAAIITNLNRSGERRTGSNCPAPTYPASTGPLSRFT